MRGYGSTAGGVLSRFPSLAVYSQSEFVEDAHALAVATAIALHLRKHRELHEVTSIIYRQIYEVTLGEL